MNFFFDKKKDAIAVLDKAKEMIKEKSVVSVEEFFDIVIDLTGIICTNRGNKKRVWSTFSGSIVYKTDGGYILWVPAPHYVDKDVVYVEQ